MSTKTEFADYLRQHPHVKDRVVRFISDLQSDDPGPVKDPETMTVEELVEIETEFWKPEWTLEEAIGANEWLRC